MNAKRANKVGKADCDIYKRVMSEIEHELGTEKSDTKMLQAIDTVIRQLRDYEAELPDSEGEG